MPWPADKTCESGAWLDTAFGKSEEPNPVKEGTIWFPSEADRPDQAIQSHTDERVLASELESVLPWLEHPWFAPWGKRPADMVCQVQRDGAVCYLLSSAEQLARCVFLVPRGGYLNVGRHIELPGRCRRRRWTLGVSMQGRVLRLASGPYHLELGPDPIAAYGQIQIVTRAIHMGEKSGLGNSGGENECCSIGSEQA